LNREKNEIKSFTINVTIKMFFKALLLCLGCLLIFKILVDGIFNDFLANTLYEAMPDLYHLFVTNKTTIFYISFFIFAAISIFYVVYSSGKYIGVITNAMDKLIKNPNKEVELPSDLNVAENTLNKIRLDIINSQNEAKESEAKKNDLIMYMAHDLKTPLTSVIGYLTLLTDEKEISKDLQDKYMNIALDKAKRLEYLTNEFFDITRFNLQKMPIEKANLNLSYLLEQLLDECYPMLQDKGLNCNLDIPKIIEYYGDGEKLARAFDNLLKNAINYSHENTAIDIIIKEKEDNIYITFKNKGDKIPEHKLNKLFEKFYRTDESRTSNTGGAGLGLAITKQIIESHNGIISVKNEDEYIEFNIILKK